MGEASRRKKTGEYPQITAKVKAPRPVEQLPDGGLDWELVGDAQAHPKTADLLAALESLKDEIDPTLGGKVMTACLETSERVPVLVARTVGLSGWMSLIAAFQDLDLTDRLEHVHVHREPYDAAFN